MNEILHAQHIYKSFNTSSSQEVQVLEDISFSVAKGEKTVITGESGSGKTTLLSILSGLDNVDSGSVFITDTDITKMNEEARANFRLAHIGFVFQYHYLLKDFTALGNVMLPLTMLGTPHAEAHERASLIIEQIGLTNRKNHHPSQLSGGECQRVAIARALVHAPLLVLADEPTGALDHKNSELIKELLCQLVEAQQSSLIITTHDHNFLPIATKHWNMDNKSITRIRT